MELWETYFFATNNTLRLTGHAISENNAQIINKIFILGEINDHFIQIACWIISLYWITQVWVHFVSFSWIIKR